MNFRPLVGEDKQVRVVSWNTNFPGRKTAKRQGDLLRELDPDLMLLQEVNPGSSEVLRDAAGADWMVRAIDLRTPEPDDLPVHRGVAIAGRGLPLRRKWLLGEIEQSERILLIETQTKGTPFITASYHAPPGVSWKIIKPHRQSPLLPGCPDRMGRCCSAPTPTRR